ncbi:MAG: efflux RND transporter periplasmic adaptor subunit [Endomicrobia bacterium]|nr:efflux RND transporter periplasmic adaptor subunit [Endomicrobiia bacterium]
MKFFKLLLVAAVSLVLFSCSQEKKNIIGEADATEIDVGVKVPGRIAEIFVKEGESVKKGRILARLEGKELDAKLKTVDAALAEAQDQLSLAQKTYDRIKNLYETGVVPKQQFDETEYKYNAAKQKVQAVKGQYDEVMAYYGELTVTAPIDGEIVQIISNPGELVSTGYPILTIFNPDDIWAVFNIREDNLKDIAKGASYKVFFPALDKTAEMEVTYISALGTFASWKPTSQQGNYDLKTFEVRLKSKEKIENLRPGMTAALRTAK